MILHHFGVFSFLPFCFSYCTTLTPEHPFQRRWFPPSPWPFLFSRKHKDKQSSASKEGGKKSECRCEQNARSHATQDITLPCVLLLQHLELRCVFVASSVPHQLVTESEERIGGSWYGVCVRVCERDSVHVYLCLWDIVSSNLVTGTERNGGRLVLKSRPLQGEEERETERERSH